MTVTTGVAEGSDEVLAALDGLSQAVKANVQDERLLLRHIDQLRAGRAQGRSWRDLLTQQKSPGVLGLAGQVLQRLTGAAGTVRRALAHALRAEGMMIPAIAGLFGVSHQRISALLRRHR